MTLFRFCSKDDLRQLALGEDPYKFIFEHSAEALLLTTPNGEILRANPAACDLFGYTEADLRAAGRKALVDESDPRFVRAIKQREKTGHFQGEITLVRANGERFEAEVSTNVFTDDGGQPLISMILRDVTERRHMEDALRESRERFRLALEHAPIGMALVGLDGRFLQVNKSLCHLVGYSSEELTRLTFQDITHPDDLEEDVEHARMLSLGKIETYEMEKRYFHKDGHIVWVLLTAATVRSESGSPLYFISQIQDISLRKAYEAELLHSRDQAQRANLAKGRFLAQVTHELKNPLNTILGYGELVAAESAQVDIRDYAKIIIRSGIDLLTLIDELLDSSQINAGQLQVTLADVPLKESLSESLDRMRTLADERNLRLLVEPVPDVCVKADPSRLKQVFANLLSNAIKYNRRGGEVKIRFELLPHHRIQIQFSDTGPGLTQEDLQRLFVPFERLGADQKDVKGHGLGLSVSKNLIEAMGGRLLASSEPNHGSCFTVELSLTSVRSSH